jgi:glycosyltransferase involved in cell wall biosynthesis
MNVLDLSIILLTRDEEPNLPFTLASIEPLGAHVFVVDSGSIDRTCQIAESAGCHVVEHPFTTYAEQLNWALDHLPLESAWVMRLDADERVTPELVEELRRVLPAALEDANGFELKRRVYFWGRWIKHGGYYPTWLLRIWRRGSARCEGRWMDEHMVSSGGRVERLAHDIVDENHKGLTFWTDKHNGYADREVRDLLSLQSAREEADLEGQAGRKRWMKVNFYARSPLFLRAFAYWGLRYFVQRGFLDGRPGLVFHFLQGFWYRFLVDAKLVERRLAGGEPSRDGGESCVSAARAPSGTSLAASPSGALHGDLLLARRPSPSGARHLRDTDGGRVARVLPAGVESGNR